jgi:zinc transport system permease protein
MEQFQSIIDSIAAQFPDRSFFNFSPNLNAMLAILLVGLICAGMGGLVVGNRMAFFSDALAHCAFAGVALGVIVCIAFGVSDDAFRDWITAVMVAFGVAVGVLIAWVRDRTGLASDTVIGVFFAFAVGLGAVFIKLIAQQRRAPSLETFCFGDPLTVTAGQIAILAGLLVAVSIFLVWHYNELVLTSAHPSLALSRRVPVVFLRFVLVILLALIVNLSLQIVGVLLITGMLIVPAAAAANLSRNLRQHFWWTVALTVGCGLIGQGLSWEISERSQRVELGIGGVILVLLSLTFFVSMAVGPLLRGRPTQAKP